MGLLFQPATDLTGDDELAGALADRGRIVAWRAAHPEVAIGMERFKRPLRDRSWRYSPDLFTAERFFDFSDGATNLAGDAADEADAAVDDVLAMLTKEAE